jgi:hypothetical protein
MIYRIIYTTQMQCTRGMMRVGIVPLSRVVVAGCNWRALKDSWVARGNWLFLLDAEGSSVFMAWVTSWCRFGGYCNGQY